MALVEAPRLTSSAWVLVSAFGGLGIATAPGAPRAAFGWLLSRKHPPVEADEAAGLAEGRATREPRGLGKNFCRIFLCKISVDPGLSSAVGEERR
jgi:hypothetical protein